MPVNLQYHTVCLKWFYVVFLYAFRQSLLHSIVGTMWQQMCKKKTCFQLKGWFYCLEIHRHKNRACQSPTSQSVAKALLCGIFVFILTIIFANSKVRAMWQQMLKKETTLRLKRTVSVFGDSYDNLACQSTTLQRVSKVVLYGIFVFCHTIRLFLRKLFWICRKRSQYIFFFVYGFQNGYHQYYRSAR